MSTEQQTLVEKYVPLANKLAYQKKRSLPNFIDIEELQSAAYFGLVEAASRFDAGLGIAFSTYAYPRIFGAIQDFLRDNGWGKRGEKIQMNSLDVELTDEAMSLKDTVEAKVDDNGDEAIEAICVGLDDQAGKVMRHYFIDEYSMKEVGEKFGVSESRISQLIKQYKDKIRGRWSKDDLMTELAA